MTAGSDGGIATLISDQDHQHIVGLPFVRGALIDICADVHAIWVEVRLGGDEVRPTHQELFGVIAKESVEAIGRIV